MTSSIFIVGVPRSGTTLLATLLAGHQRLSGGPETHVFDRLAREQENALTDPNGWPDRAVDFLFSITHAENAVPANYGLTRDEVATYLRSREPSIPAILESLTDTQRAKLGKARWVEKTPDHLPHVATIRRHYREARILRIVRDPRDVALSLLRVPWGPKTFVDALLFWHQYDKVSRNFFQADDGTHTVRYEDLVRAPEQQLRQICEFLEEDFDPNMLDTREPAKVVDSYRRPWLANVHRSIDQRRADAWRDQLSEFDVALTEALLGDRLRDFAYTTDGGSCRNYAKLYPAEVVQKSGSVIEDLTRKSYRFWPLTPDEAPAAFVFLGAPTAYLMGGGRRRFARRSRLLLTLGVQHLRHKNVVWAAPSGS